jgi:ABC-type Fe3+-siderophore transport system permease subunit
MISLFFGALVVTGLSVLSPEKLQSALFWLLGQLGTTRDKWIYYLGPFFLIGAAVLAAKSGALDALSLGESRAMSLGYSPKKERTFLIFLCALLTALGVSIAGLIGFVGLVSPHMARRILGTSKHRILLWGSFFTGGILMVFADAVGRTVAGNSEVPAGSVAALFGAPVLIVLLMRQRHARND